MKIMLGSFNMNLLGTIARYIIIKALILNKWSNICLSRCVINNNQLLLGIESFQKGYEKAKNISNGVNVLKKITLIWCHLKKESHDLSESINKNVNG